MKNKIHANRIIVMVLIIALLIMSMSWIGWKYFHSSDKEAFPLLTSSDTTHEVSVVYINAGHADSMLVKIDGHSYLIDTGLKSSVSHIEAVIDKYSVEKIEGIFLTHTHKDHIGGLKKIVDKYNIGILYAAEISMNDNDESNAIEKKAEKIGVSLSHLTLGDKVLLADDVYFEVLGPIVYNDSDDNDNSLVLRLFVNGRAFLFTGDMQFAEEQTLLNYGIDVSADILKVGNHGNPDATSERFAKAVSPEIAVFTTDRTEDKDSANETVQSYFENAEIFVTEDYDLGILVEVDENGEIHVSAA